MFGKIEWFQTVKNSKFVKPAVWQGWAYLAAWAGVLLVPTKILFAIQHTPEAFIWMLFSTAVFAFDYSKVSKAVRQKSEYDKLFFIGDDSDNSSVTTSNYDLKIE